LQRCRGGFFGCNLLNFMVFFIRSLALI